MVSASAIIMIPVAWATEGPINLTLAPQTYGAIVYFSVASTAFAYLLYYRVLAMAGSGNLMLVTLLVAPVAIILGALVLGEALPHHAYAGFALLALGLAVLDGRIFGNRRVTKPAG
jgi:drug/metabolite transporter (DMT)-like permease